jgi:ParB family chromosome partitioning protein
MSKQPNKGLGKGFGSLLPQDFDQSMLLDKHDRIQKIALGDIKADPTQPRRSFDENLIDELSESIKRYGILQPIVVTEKSGTYSIVAGERRYRAAVKAGLDRIPVLVRSLEELERLEISLVENVQRVDLNPIEQAVSIARLHEQFNMGYQEIAKRLGKAQTTVLNIVRLLQLPEFARDALVKGKISEGHARAVLALKTPELQQELLQNIEQLGWSVRAAEQFVSDKREKKTNNLPLASSTRTNVNQKLSKSLSTKLGFNVTVAEQKRGGKISMSFTSRQQFEDFIAFLENQKK